MAITDDNINVDRVKCVLSVLQQAGMPINQDSRRNLIHENAGLYFKEIGWPDQRSPQSAACQKPAS